MRVSNVIRALESVAPPSLAAEWDNVGLLIGDGDAPVSKLLLCIDLTAEVLAEAVAGKAQMVMAYHPVIFRPVSRLTAAATPVAYEAARRGLAVYSMHTALDAAPGGTNDVLAEAMGLLGARPLEPAHRDEECKVVVFVPATDLANVAEAAFAAGAGRIDNYFDCAFFTHGIGTFMGGEDAHPTIGQSGQHEAVEEVRLEMVCPAKRLADVVLAVRAAHSYEAPVVDVYRLENLSDASGLGRIGRLARPATERAVIDRVKKAIGLKKLHVAPGHAAGRTTRKVTTAACCAGSCGKVYQAALDGGATLLVTGEMRHHDALAATGAGMTVVCLGHSNSERLALTHLAQRLAESLPKLSVVTSRRDADPFQIV